MEKSCISKLTDQLIECPGDGSNPRDG